MELGPWGYVAFVAAYAALQPFGVPGTVFIMAAPLIWPWPVAFALSMAGTMAASVVGFLVRALRRARLGTRRGCRRGFRRLRREPWRAGVSRCSCSASSSGCRPCSTCSSASPGCASDAFLGLAGRVHPAAPGDCLFPVKRSSTPCATRPSVVDRNGRRRGRRHRPPVARQALLQARRRPLMKVLASRQALSRANMRAACSPMAPQDSTSANGANPLIISPVGAGKIDVRTAALPRPRRLQLNLDEWMARLFR